MFPSPTVGCRWMCLLTMRRARASQASRFCGGSCGAAAAGAHESVSGGAGIRRECVVVAAAETASSDDVRLRAPTPRDEELLDPASREWHGVRRGGAAPSRKRSCSG